MKRQLEGSSDPTEIRANPIRQQGASSAKAQPSTAGNSTARGPGYAAPMSKHTRFHDASDGPSVLPDTVPVKYGASRETHRRSLMLDDSCLDVKDVELRRYEQWKVLLYTFACFITAGTVAIVAYWPSFRRKKERWLSVLCSAEQADFALVEAPDGSYEVCPVEEVAQLPLELQDYWEAQRIQRNRPAASIPLARRMYVFRHVRYLYRPSLRSFARVEADEVYCPADPLQGLDSKEGQGRLMMIGRNVIDVPIPPIPVLLVREVLHPFVIFQVWAVIVWLTESYWSFSIFILCTALLTAGLNLRDVLRNLNDIRRLSRYVTEVTVLRDGGVRQTVPSDEIVPGDVVIVPRTMKLPCDMVLVQGQATVTEAMLTGEATVVVKTPVVPTPGGTDDFPAAVARADMRNTLFGGTQVVELRVPKGQDVLGVVVRTGYDTVKGRLVLSILHPRASHFKFMDEAIRFVGILFACAMVGFVVNAKALADNGAGPEKIVQRGADLITIVVPPALPLAVTVGTLYALMALRKDRIFCISPPKVNLAGKINAFCFDKTGTLTTEGLELATLRPAAPVQAVNSTAVASTLQASAATGSPLGLSPVNTAPPPSTAFLPDTDRPAELSLQFQALLACCHSLTHVAGQLAGDPLELKTFAFTRAALEEPHTSADDTGSSEAEHGQAQEQDNGRAGKWDGAHHEHVSLHFSGAVSAGGSGALLAPSPLAADASSGSAGEWSPSPLAGTGASADGGRAGTAGKGGRGKVGRTVPPHVVSRVFLPAAATLQSGGTAASPASAAGTDPVRSSFSSFSRSSFSSFSRSSFSSFSRSSSSEAQAVDVLHVFSFVPALQRMGVLAQPVVGDGDASASAPVIWYVKGSPEAVHALCVPGTLPTDYWEVLGEYARQGLRVLGAAYRMLPAEYAARAIAAGTDAALSESLRREVETSLTFLGFIVLENRLKPETAPVIARLRKEAGLSMHMATGDNGVSAVAVARQCGLVEPGARVFLADTVVEGASPGGTSISGGTVIWTDVDDAGNSLDPSSLLPMRPLAPLPASAAGSAAGSLSPSAMLSRATERSARAGPGVYRLAMTGRAFDALRAQVQAGQLPARTLARALINCAVFARMSPENKAALVEALQAQGLYVGMIGDGANDSMALRAAHVGISLSQVEASVAAPFTYAVPNPSIDAIPRVLAEGRGALATSFCLFQFMALYSTIQFATAVQIAFSGSFLSNNMYLFQDLFVVFILSFSLGQTPSSSVLTAKRPSGRLGSVYNLTITFGFIALTFALQAAVYALVRAKTWFGSKEYPAAMAKDADAEGTNSAIPETTSLFLMANFQYLACAAIFSWGHPWKRAPTTNPVFCAWMVVVAITSTVIMLGPTDAVYSSISLQRMPQAWHGELFALSLAAFASYFIFMAVVRSAKAAGFFSRLERRGPPKPHKELRKEWKAQFASAAVADGAGASAVQMGLPVSIRPQQHGGSTTGAGTGTGVPVAGAGGGLGIHRVRSDGWNTSNSLLEPTTPLPLRG